MSTYYKYMVYTRDEGGRIAREHRTVLATSEDIKIGYRHTEKLLGWPESSVYWSTAYGLGNGLAPISKAAPESLHR